MKKQLIINFGLVETLNHTKKKLKSPYALAYLILIRINWKNFLIKKLIYFNYTNGRIVLIKHHNLTIELEN